MFLKTLIDFTINEPPGMLVFHTHSYMIFNYVNITYAHTHTHTYNYDTIRFNFAVYIPS